MERRRHPGRKSKRAIAVNSPYLRRSHSIVLRAGSDRRHRRLASGALALQRQESPSIQIRVIWVEKILKKMLASGIVL